MLGPQVLSTVAEEIDIIGETDPGLAHVGRRLRERERQIAELVGDRICCVTVVLVCLLRLETPIAASAERSTGTSSGSANGQLGLREVISTRPPPALGKRPVTSSGPVALSNTSSQRSRRAERLTDGFRDRR